MTAHFRQPRRGLMSLTAAFLMLACSPMAWCQLIDDFMITSGTASLPSMKMSQSGSASRIESASTGLGEGYVFNERALELRDENQMTSNGWFYGNSFSFPSGPGLGRISQSVWADTTRYGFGEQSLSITYRNSSLTPSDLSFADGFRFGKSNSFQSNGSSGTRLFVTTDSGTFIASLEAGGGNEGGWTNFGRDIRLSDFTLNGQWQGAQLTKSALRSTQSIQIRSGGSTWLVGYGFTTIDLNRFEIIPQSIAVTITSGTQTQAQAGYSQIQYAAALSKTGLGTLVLDAANTFSSSLNVSEGAVVAANVQAIGTATLEVAAGATFAISPVVGAANAVQVADLGTISGNIDVSTGRFALPASGDSPGAELRSLLVAGRSGGTWDGAAGIISSNAPAHDSASGFAVGYRVAGDNSATVAWASLGDADLDGAVTTADVNAILTSGLLNTGTPGALWQQGDFDYDGLVTTADINALLTTGRLNSGNYLPALAAPAAVPEPATYLMLLTGIACCQRRRNG